MNRIPTDQEFESQVALLERPEVLRELKEMHDLQRVSWLPRILAGLLVHAGNAAYGKKPSYLKFRSVEVIARVPYQSWEAVGFMLLTLFYTDERRALKLAETTAFARLAQDNETMHVVVISALAKAEGRAHFLRDTLVPVVFAFLYYFASVILYLLRPRWSFELNYLFEQEAFEQYDAFLEMRGDELKTKTLTSAFLNAYGRHPENQFEFFRSVRNDELIHRNESAEGIKRTS